MKPVDIIVVHLDVLCLFKEFLECLTQNTTVPYRLIVVDNNSRNSSIDFLRQKHREGVIACLVEAKPPFPLRYDHVIQSFKPFGGIEFATEPGILTHGQCLDLGYKHVEGDFYVTIDTDAFVKPGWMERMMKEMENPSVCCVGDSKCGPYNTSRIWVANCLTRDSMSRTIAGTYQPVHFRDKFYDTGDFLSTLFWLRYNHVHIPNCTDYWDHISSVSWFYNCLRPEPEYRSYRLYDEQGRCWTKWFRRKKVVATASAWYLKLLQKHQTYGCDLPWTQEDHDLLIERMKDLNSD